MFLIKIILKRGIKIMDEEFKEFEDEETLDEDIDNLALDD